MALRISRLGFVGLVTLPLISANCGSSEDRNFTPGGSAGAGASGGSAGSTGGSSATGGSAGSTGGSAGSTGGSAGSTGGTAGGDGGIACTDSSECDDGNSCNGTETCVSSVCQAGTPESNGTSCTLPTQGDAGASDAGAAEYICVNSVCSLKCTTDGECDDNNVCTGSEICNPSTQTCQSGTPPACEDNDACTDNQCDPTTGCFYPLIDADNDKHASTTLGACGTDCDDNDDTTYPGAADLCGDNKDNNCNGQIDEGAPTWYADCDKDTYAPAGAQSIANLCTAPTTPPTCDSGLSGGWTNKAPVVGSSDCWDKDAKGHPMTVSESNAAWSSTPMANVPPVSIDYDFNCDGTEEKHFTNTFVSTSASCSPCGFAGGFGIGGAPGQVSGAAGIGGIGGIGGSPALLCCGTHGWTSSSPACGATGTYTTCSKIGSSCQRLTVLSKKQECR